MNHQEYVVTKRNETEEKKQVSYHSESILVVQKELIVRKEILNPIQLVDLLLAALYKLYKTKTH